LEPEDFPEDEDLVEPDLDEDFLIFDWFPEEDEELELESELYLLFVFALSPEDELLLEYFLILKPVDFSGVLSLYDLDS
jgi:hypothetical protein